MIDEVRPGCQALEHVVLPRHARLGQAAHRRLARRRSRPRRALSGRSDSTTRSTSSTRSGTTGSPKGATLSHHNILNNGYFVGECCGYTEADRVCIPVPFYHCFGMVMGNLGCTTHGACDGAPGAALRARPRARGGAGRALHERSTASPRCSSPSWRSRTSTASTCPACAPGSWPARRARSR